MAGPSTVECTASAARRPLGAWFSSDRDSCPRDCISSSINIMAPVAHAAAGRNAAGYHRPVRQHRHIRAAP
ncbi:hypothetical protein GCM10017781_17350 [Deinococcus metalli]|uniref:Uncharacterized protein n=1 Tax=Deinococcus metalli TaxID=1141878 RepID=A0ABQ3JSG7_9DEIO|nr:hypothetical protein GCM10017781_17350 [Deinococcus metalli]